MEKSIQLSLGEAVIPSISDPAANAANMAAIDRLVRTTKYLHIVAWGKWLGFAPKTVQESVDLAEAEEAPVDAVQKLNGEWTRMGDLMNEENRKKVEELVRKSTSRSR